MVDWIREALPAHGKEYRGPSYIRIYILMIILLLPGAASYNEGNKRGKHSSS